MNLHKILTTFEKNYVSIPLEAFGEDGYKTLVSTLLSSRTKDEVTFESSLRLLKIAPDIEKLSKTPVGDISKAIYPVGFYNQKAKYLKKMACILVKNNQGKIPHTREGLMSLPGVGRKTANLVLNRAFKIPTIAVDTHVHRISNMLGIVDTTTPAETEMELIKIFPKKYWHKLNRLFVSIGRQYRSKKALDNFFRQNNLYD